MWGRLVFISCAEYRQGNTPTHVGKTINQSQSRLRQKKHPHACGEDYPRLVENRLKAETPPRMWGRLAELFGREHKNGNTPTHVGKTG